MSQEYFTTLPIFSTLFLPFNFSPPPIPDPSPPSPSSEIEGNRTKQSKRGRKYNCRSVDNAAKFSPPSITKPHKKQTNKTMSMSLSCITHNTTSKSISSGSQACAACKYQRRKCARDCVLAPYFPHERQEQFLNAHKLFGVSNITKIIKDLKPDDKDIAMRTIVYQSDVRARDPVGGCQRIIVLLQQQIESQQFELGLVLQQITLCRAHQAAAYQQQQRSNLQSFYDQEYVNAQKELSDDDDDGAGKVPTHDQQQQDQDFQYSWELQDSMWTGSKESCTEGGDDRVEEKPPMDQIVNLGQDHLEIVAFEKDGFVKFDHQQATEKSKMILKAENETFEGDKAALEQHPIQEHDLRSAATMFTLTSSTMMWSSRDQPPSS